MHSLQQDLQQGQICLHAGKYVEAERIFSRILQRQHSPFAVFGRGLALVLQKQDAGVALLDAGLQGLRASGMDLAVYSGWLVLAIQAASALNRPLAPLLSWLAELAEVYRSHPQASAFRELAKQALDAGVPDRLAALLASYPLGASAEYFYWQGEMLLLQCDRPSALLAFDRVFSFQSVSNDLKERIFNRLLTIEQAALVLRYGYQQWLAADCPVDLLRLYAKAAYSAGDALLALSLAAKVLALFPDDREMLRCRAFSLDVEGCLHEACAAYRAFLEKAPDYLDAAVNLASRLIDLKEFDEAVRVCQQYLSCHPMDSRLWVNLAAAECCRQNWGGVVEACTRAARIHPDIPQLYTNLTKAKLAQKQLVDALTAAIMAVHLQPDSARAYLLLGKVWREFKRADRERVALLKAEALQPESPDVQIALAMNEYSAGLYSRTEERLLAVLRADPSHLDALLTAAYLYANWGRTPEAFSMYERAFAIDPANLTRSGYLFFLANSPEGSGEKIYEQALLYANYHVPEASICREHPWIVRNPERRLRLGFLSSDLRDHSVAYFVEPIFSNIDRSQFEIFVYSNTAIEDAISDRIKKQVDCWRPVADLNDQQLFDLVVNDRIDVLTDLNGHTAGHRLHVVGRKPAPVVIGSYIGFMGTTGLKGVDYRFMSDFQVIQSVERPISSERLWMLPGPVVVYRPCVKSPARRYSPELAVMPAPVHAQGVFTFGLTTRMTRVTDFFLASCARILALVPCSRLLIEAPGLSSDTDRQALLARCAAVGIEPNQLVLINRDTANQYIIFNQIDLQLDPFPQNSGTTLIDGVWMGVPLITLAGRTAQERLGRMVAYTVGHSEWVANTVDEYVGKAAEMAAHITAGASNRLGLRKEIEDSLLMNESEFTNMLSRAYRQMFADWCSEMCKNNSKVD